MGWNEDRWDVDPWGGGPDVPHSAYFLPPIAGEYVPAPPRLDMLGVPRSPHYRQFLRIMRGADISIAGVNYLGGRWNGPLSQTEIQNIIAAGYVSRIYYTPEDSTGIPAQID